MPIVMTPHREDLAPAVRAMNERLRTGGVAFAFPESPVSRWLPRVPGRTLFQEYYLAVDGHDVRGGYILKHQQFSLRGEQLSIGAYQLPLSEGTIDKTYASVGVQTMLDCLRRQPLAYTLGIGSRAEPFAKVLEAAGWAIVTVPFFLRVVHPYRFLRGLAYLRRDPRRRLLLDAAALSGIGPLALRAYQRWTTRREVVPSYEVVPRFEGWVDEVWERGQRGYSLAAIRDRANLDVLYPDSVRRFLRIRVTSGGHTIGWATCLSTQMVDNPYFGDLRVGSIVDCFAAMTDAERVVRAATDFLVGSGADLIISNQGHSAWCGGFSQVGYTAGPSNFLLAMSRHLTRRLQPLADHQHALHFTRGDGDGPYNL